MKKKELKMKASDKHDLVTESISEIKTEFITVKY
jgi:hypothetical protein